MSRPEHGFQSAGEAAHVAEELAALLARDRGEARLQQALACYFAAGEGWRDAEAVLGGAFAISGAAAKALDAGETE